MAGELEFALMQPHVLLVQDLHSEHVTHTRHKSFSFWPRYVFKGAFSFSTSDPLASTAFSCVPRALMGKGANYLPQQLQATALVTGAQFRLSSGFLQRSRHKTREALGRGRLPEVWTSLSTYLLCRVAVVDWLLQAVSSWSVIFWRSRLPSRCSFSFSAVICAISTFP